MLADFNDQLALTEGFNDVSGEPDASDNCVLPKLDFLIEIAAFDVP